MIDKKRKPCYPPFACAEFVLLDIETSGLNEERDRVISVSADKIIDGNKAERFFSFVAFEGALPPDIAELTGIRDELLKGAPGIDTVMKNFAAFRGDLPIYADNAPFMRKFLKKYGLEIFERDGDARGEFEATIDTMTENDGIMSAICASDLNFVRTMYELTSVEKIQTEGLETLRNRLCDLSAAPYDAFVIVLYIPQYALKKIVQGIDLGGKFVLVGTVGSEGFRALVGCYKKR